MNFEDLKRIPDSGGERSGWDFSRVRDERDRVPWELVEVVRRYLQPEDRVLDTGTGGGEIFLGLSTRFDTGVGLDLDAEMIRVARKNAHKHSASHVSFEPMDAQYLRFSESSFDIVLNRHAPTEVVEIVRVLRPGTCL